MDKWRMERTVERTAERVGSRYCTVGNAGPICGTVKGESKQSSHWIFSIFGRRDIFILVLLRHGKAAMETCVGHMGGMTLH